MDNVYFKLSNDNKNGCLPCILKHNVLSVLLKENQYNWTPSHSWIAVVVFFFFFLALCTDLEHANIFPYGSPKLPDSFFICWGSSCRKCHSSFLGNCTPDQKSNQAANNVVLLACFLPLSCLHCACLYFRDSMIQSDAGSQCSCGAFMLGTYSPGKQPTKGFKKEQKMLPEPK